MKTETLPRTRTVLLSDRLKKLDIGGQITLQNGAMSCAEQAAWYRAARVAGIKVSVRTFPTKVLVIRLA